MTLQESVYILKRLLQHPNTNGYMMNNVVIQAASVAVDAIERSINIEEWDAEESQIEEICNRCNGQGCSKCS